MSHRAHLFSLRLGQALRETLRDAPYSANHFSRDLLAGLTVGVIAIPLAMALAIASGVAPQYGLYTAAIAGFVIALCGGSRFSVSGPTAAYVVLLVPIAEKWGLAGLLLAGLMAGTLLVLMALLRLGRFIEYIPESVTLGFTSGIGVVIAALQIKDVLGLQITGPSPEHFTDKMLQLLPQLEHFAWPSLLLAGFTFAVLRAWPLLNQRIPAHLVAVICATLAGLWMHSAGWSVDTIGSRFSYLLADGSAGAGIPRGLPEFTWPWQQPGADGQPLQLSLQLLRDLLPAAFAIAMLGAIESLLCAVVLDGMSGTRHSANSELLGQGIGNLVVPFFGGITATAAIARSAANLRAGAVSPVAAMVHSLVVLLSLWLLADILSYLPMPAMAALLVGVAWNMSEAPKSVHLLKTSPGSDIAVWVCCFGLTIFFDMVIAISAGILLAAVLFMKEVAAMTRVSDISANNRLINQPLPANWIAVKITGPLFFAAADRVFGELAQLCNAKQGILIYMDGVTLLDAGGIANLIKFVNQCQKTDTQLHIADLQFQPLRTLHKSGFQPGSHCTFHATLQAALDTIGSPPGDAVHG